MDIYTESFNIPAGGWTGQASALNAGTAGTAPINVSVRLWRDPADAAPTDISLRPGHILPIKVRWISHSSTVTGFN